MNTTLKSPSLARQLTTSSKPSLLLIGQLQHCQREWDNLHSKYKLLQFRGNRAQFLSSCKFGLFDGTVGLYRTNSITETGHFDHELISTLPRTLKFIGLNGAGYDGMDINALAQRGIKVSNTPGVVAGATADVAMFLILGALRRAMIPLEAIRNGQWKGDTPLGNDPGGKILGIIGMGSIGQALARRAAAFGMKIMYHNRSRLPEEKEGVASYATFDQVLQFSDILSLNLPATPQTHHLISEQEFQKMKDGVVVINTARGSLLDEEALVKALQTGKVSSAGLDVYGNEPRVHPELLNDKRIMILPHIGTTTVETKRNMELLAIQNLENALDREELLTPIPEC
ncbi:hypothetical protein ASPWEDRAFT_39145 [Aspergillus wentii DTO 134E9]|uniref:D-isomer specific 2-hydroxyacid dehydrogenase NAD-binding domain-containing protein n=1 Tax=Aspergillus wentii DTO 134E9 TaxID=1073089 RepID=A0A1L9RR78_ASPWE|nr:uncharacterized protein ASPWEDRAFT_39145 [Aspergillus wentii DTO 134E9]OJJ37460.1 hypothetical protein ASPWEDRAFT_39145 [Aspergillus wentii DTO 134E9]